MNNKKIIMAGLCICILASCFFIKNFNNENKLVNTDGIKFKEEYESLNGKINESTGKPYLNIDISINNHMKYSTYDEIKEVITEGTGIIYFGFPQCPWCRNAVPVLLSAAEEAGIDTIYYFNALSIRDKKYLDDNGNIVVENEGTAEYKELVKLLYGYLDVYSGLNDDTIKRLYFPTVIFVKNGHVIGSHSGTVNSQTNPSIPLDESQYKELQSIYATYIKELNNNLCSIDSQKKC